MTQEELSSRSGLTTTQIGRAERGENPATVKTLYKLSKGLNVDLKDIVDVETQYVEPLTDDFVKDELLKAVRPLNHTEQMEMVGIVRSITKMIVDRRSTL